MTKTAIQKQCLKLYRSSDIGAKGRFQQQLTECGLDSNWVIFTKGYLLPGSEPDAETTEALGRLFCQLNGLPIVLEGSVLLAKIPKQSGYVVRFRDLELLLQELSLRTRWDQYFMGSTFCLLNEEGPRQTSNWAIYWHDVIRFFDQCNIVCEALRNTMLPADKFLSAIAANVSLSGLDTSEQICELASLVANGIISQDEALKRLNIEVSKPSK